MAKKVIIWGMGSDYECLLNSILFEIFKGNIAVEAVVCKKIDIFCKKRDGFPIITKEQIREIEYEYVLVTSSRFFEEIKNEAIAEGIAEDKIIDAHIFTQTFFDFARYSSLIEDPVTIISDDCWSGYAYHQLKLPFSSPFINIDIDNEDYARLILDLDFFLNTELTMIREGNIQEGIYPIARLGDDKRQVRLNLLHDLTFADGKKRWDRRKVRINPKNIFLKMRLATLNEGREESIRAFESVPYKKVLFYNGNEEIRGKFETDRFVWRQNRVGKTEYHWYSAYLRTSYKYDLDLLKLLTGDQSYSRYL